MILRKADYDALRTGCGKRGGAQMRTKTKKTALYIAALAVIVLLIAALLIYRFALRPPAGDAADSVLPPAATPQIIYREKTVEKLVEVEKRITAAVLEEGLRDMGVLVTQEFIFTEVISASNIKTLDLDFKLFHINEALPFTESSFVASYDGTVTAGVDCAGITVSLDEEQGAVTVTLPGAEIFTVDVDPDSFRLYDEKQGMGTRITVDDYNRALTELEANAAARAVERGILDRADRNAQLLLRNFLESMLGDTAYTVRFETPD